MKQPLLSILIPTYKYKIGIQRIFYFFNNIPWAKCEVLIYDNSPNEETKNFVDDWRKNNKYANVLYRLNSPSTGPAENWNNLLDDAKGEYCLLLHNGEFPDKLDFFNQLVVNLENVRPDIALVNCILSDLENLKASFHLPIYFKIIVFKYFPSYLFQNNVIGPTSALIIKRKNYAAFDPNLNWLLDVDSYYRSLLASPKRVVFPNLAMISVINKNDTLTKKLGSHIKEIELKERQYLSSKYNQILWNKSKKFFLDYLVVYFEKIFWKLLSVKYRIYKLLTSKQVEKKYKEHLLCIARLR